MTKLRQRDLPRVPKNDPVLIEKCEPERIVNILALKFQADLAALGIEASLDSLRDFTRALLGGEISLDDVDPAKIANTSELPKAVTEDAKQFAKDLAALIAIHDGDDSQTLPNTFALLLNRGILPLSTLTNDPGKQKIVAAISEKSGLSTGRVIEVCTVVEEYDEVARALALKKLYNAFSQENDLETDTVDTSPLDEMPSLTIDLTPKRSRSDQALAAVTSVQKGNGSHRSRSDSPSHKQRRFDRAEISLQETRESLTLLSRSAASIIDIICKRILNIENAFSYLENGDIEETSTGLNPPNMWMGAAGLIQGNVDFVILQANSQIHYTSSTVLAFPAVLCAQATDIVMEALLVDDLARFLLESEPGSRDESFIRGARNLSNIVKRLHDLQLNIAAGVRNPNDLHAHTANTSVDWASISQNPLLVSTSLETPSRKPLSDAEILTISMAYHTPLAITRPLVEGRVQTNVLDIEIVEGSAIPQPDIDGDTKFDLTFDFARHLRRCFGSAGIEIDPSDMNVRFNVEDAAEVSRVLSPLYRLFGYTQAKPLTLPGL